LKQKLKLDGKYLLSVVDVIKLFPFYNILVALHERLLG